MPLGGYRGAHQTIL